GLSFCRRFSSCEVGAMLGARAKSLAAKAGRSEPQPTRRKKEIRQPHRASVRIPSSEIRNEFEFRTSDFEFRVSDFEPWRVIPAPFLSFHRVTRFRTGTIASGAANAIGL